MASDEQLLLAEAITAASSVLPPGLAELVRQLRHHLPAYGGAGVPRFAVDAARDVLAMSAPPPVVDREALAKVFRDAHSQWAPLAGLTFYQFLADALISAGVVPTEPLPEWSCPGCGATTRARMADHEGSVGTVSGDVAGDLVDVAAQAIRANHNLDRKVVEFHTDARVVVVAVLRRLAVEIARSEPDSATVLALAGEVEKGENADATL